MPIRPDPGYKLADQGNKYKVKPEDGNKFVWDVNEEPIKLVTWLALAGVFAIIYVVVKLFKWLI